jgi:hypothetical protein
MSDQFFLYFAGSRGSLLGLQNSADPINVLVMVEGTSNFRQCTHTELSPGSKFPVVSVSLRQQNTTNLCGDNMRPAFESYHSLSNSAVFCDI